jgi:hypothetical protein
MQARQGWTPSSGGRSLQADAVAQSFSVGSKNEDSRSYLTDPSAMACRAGLSAMACQAGDQRSMAKYIIE